MIAMTAVATHPFEAAGLGSAPFRFLGMTQNIVRCGDHFQPGGTCDFCGTGIRYECRIGSSDGRTFVVGTDCVLKLDRADNRLVGEVERAVKAREAADRRAKADVRRAAEREAIAARVARRAPILDAYQAEWDAADAEYRAAVAGANRWLIEALLPAGGGFVADMIANLGREPIGDLSDRAVAILEDIYARRAGRAGSKANDAARAGFGRLAEAADREARESLATFRARVRAATEARESALAAIGERP